MSRAAGLTLVEMLVAVAVMALLAVLIMPPMGRWGDQNRLQTGAQQVIGAMREAQVRAMSQHTCHRVVLGTADEPTTVQVLYAPPETSTRACTATPTESMYKSSSVNLPDSITFDRTPPDGPGPGSITFQATGVPDLNVDAVLTLKLTRGDDKLQLQVDASTGTVRTTAAR